jgi:hypothetical protein
LLAAHRIEPDVLPDLVAACAAARAEVVDWDGRSPVPQGALALVVASIRPGERRIPAELVDLVTRERPGMPLLLLSSDPLVRSAVALHGGRVNIVSPPHTRERLASRLRLLLADRMRAPDTMRLFPTPSEQGTLVRVREHLRAKWWLGRLGAWAPEEGSPESVLPRVHQTPTAGLTAVVTPHAEPDTAEAMAAAVEIFGSSAHEVEKQAALAELYGERAGVVHLSPGGDSWSVYWPPVPGWTLWLFSPMRMPSWWNLSTSLELEGRRLLHRPARSEDLLVALTGELPSGEQGAGSMDGELGSALAAGGPPLLDLLEDRFRASPRRAVAVVVEVR